MISTTENIQTRILEIENVFLPNIKQNSEMAKENFTQIYQFKDQCELIFDKIDNLELLVSRVKTDLEKLENHVDTAEIELGIRESSFAASFLKSINPFSKPTQIVPNTPLKEYTPLEIFRADEWFDAETGANS